ncbi:class II aldolase/adducin family protein [Pseudomonas lurida]|uniref:class II aldolase/adducin family protein n=1 Tax=Pseudomonas lurida TaxID=244566 RepID=UPI0016575AA4|nr:class II aldolase/adducin family protein [Pseudomonas lurida]MBC8982401.1 class II aldolase/adducin family protein [Pseudomonas lurida]
MSRSLLAIHAPTPSLHGLVSDAEWSARVELAAAYRLYAYFGWDDLVFTHISSRVPAETGHFLINPYGYLFDEITASSLVKVDYEGRKVADSPNDVNPAGFSIHSAVHAGRPDAHCVMHAHSINGCAVSAQEGGLLPLSQQSLFVLASLAYHDYEGVALNDDEKPRLVEHLRDRTFMMLRNHGLLTVGSSVADAFLAMYIFEAACKIQVRALSGGVPVAPIGPDLLAGIAAQAKQVTHGLGGALAWPGLLRRLDRIDPGFRL